MFRLLVPKRMYHSIYSLELKELAQMGIKVIFADLDNTLAAYSEREPSEQLMKWLAHAKERGLEVFVVSNSRKSTRAVHFCEAADIPYIRHAGKPKKKGFLRAMDICGIEPHQAIMVGDQIFTDILGANRCGILSVLVKPVRLDTVFRRIRFLIETPMRKLCLWKGEWVC